MRRSTKISFQEQFIVAYGGLRGAVGFSLAEVITQEKWYRELFLTTALGQHTHYVTLHTICDHVPSFRIIYNL